jgi:GrpB-like predicted nucleotidyltransferase (UPF0157 family)
MGDNPVEIADYDPQWPPSFRALQGALGAALSDLALTIEHIGSTAVPGLPAKPILDIDVVIESATHLPRAVQVLVGLGYVHQGDLGITGREAFKRLGEDVPRDGTGRTWPEHHLYVCPQDSPELRRHLAFRDYLRAHPDQAAAYGNLKQRLAQQFRHDRDGYCNAKAAFIAEALRQAAEIAK